MDSNNYLFSFLKVAIENSFLDNETKKYLNEKLEREGVSETLCNEFNNLLLKEFKKNAEKYQKEKEEVERISEAMENEFQDKKNQLLKKLKERLQQVQPNDLMAQNKVWEDYYKELQKLQEEYLNQLKERLSKFMLNRI